MPNIHIDVVSDGPSSDVAILAVREVLADELTCTSVLDMVDQVQGRVGVSDRIGRLRIFGHGNPGIVCIGRVSASTSLSSLNMTDLSKIIGVVRQEGVAQTGETVRTSYPLFNEDALRRLAPKFSRDGWVELHACRAASGELGEQLLRRLAELWQVLVKGGIEDQFAGGGIEGMAIVAFPNGSVQRRPPAPPPHTRAGCSVSWR